MKIKYYVQSSIGRVLLLKDECSTITEFIVSNRLAVDLFINKSYLHTKAELRMAINDTIINEADCVSAFLDSFLLGALPSHKALSRLFVKYHKSQVSKT